MTKGEESIEPDCRAKRFFRSEQKANKQIRKKEKTSMALLLAEIAGNIHVAAACLGSAVGIGLIGMRASDAVGRNPGASTKILVQALLNTAFAEGIVFFAIYLAH